MIRVFLPTDRNFTSNGEVVLRPSFANVHKVDNSDYYVEITCGIEYVDFIKANNIIVCETPLGEQPFRIDKNITTTRTKINFKAWHVYYDSENYVIQDSYVVEKNCADALAWLNSATDQISPFTTGSNMTTVNSFRCVRKSLREAFETVRDRWGGHLVRDGFNVRLDAATGKDNGVIIQYRKNLKEITVSEDWQSVCTKCLPVGKDGQLLPEVFVLASVQYDVPYTKVVTFDQQAIVREDYDSDQDYINALITDLRGKAVEYLKTTQYPAINYTVEANVDRITDTGDIVQVYDERLNVNLTASVISYDYNVLTGKFDKVEFGTLGQTLSGLLGGISTSVSSAMTQIEQNWNAFLQAAVEVATAEIWQELGGGYVIVSSEQIMVVDTLPAESATFCLKIDANGVYRSSNGIAGSFVPVLSIDGTLYGDNITAQNLSLNSLSRGTLTIGGSANTSLSIKNEDGDEIGTINRSGLSLNGENIFDALFYSDGDQETIANTVCAGYINTSCLLLVFSLPLPKNDKDVVPSLSALKINARGIDGAIFNISSSGYDVLSDPDLLVSVAKNEKDLKITVESSSPIATNGDTPATVEVVSCIIDFTAV